MLLLVSNIAWLGMSLASQGYIKPVPPIRLPDLPFALPSNGSGQKIAPILQSPAPEARLKFGQNTFVGTAPPGTRVCLMGDGAEIGSAKVGATGRFELEFLIDRPAPGRLELEFIDWGLARIAEPVLFLPPLESAASHSNTFRVSRPAPNGIVRGKVLVAAGTGPPGTQVRIQLDRFLLGFAEVAPDGTWVLTRAVNSGQPKRELLVRQVGGTGDSILSRKIVIIP